MDPQLLQALMLRTPEAGSTDQFEPLMREAVRLQNEALQRAVKQPDTSRFAQAGFERERRGMDDQAAGMAMATAVPQFAQIAQQTHRAGLEAQQPMEMGEGVYMPGTGYVADPFKQQDRLTRAIASQAGAASQFATAYGGHEDRRLTRAQQQLAFEEQKRHARVMEGISGGQLSLARQQAEYGKIQKVQNADGSESLVRVHMTPAGPVVTPLSGGTTATVGSTVPGVARYPATQNPKATEGERNTGYQLESVLNSAPTAFAPGTQRPGALEALARTVLPKEVGEGVASFLSPAGRQIARTSQESIVDSLLWLSTGAAYNDPQFQQKKREVMVNYWDAPATVQFKHAKIAEMAVAARNRAGRAWTQAQEDKLLAAFPALAQGSPLAPFNPATAQPPSPAAGASPRPSNRPGDRYLEGL